MAYDFTAASSQALTVGSAPVSARPLTMACWFLPTNYNSRECLVFLGNNSNSPAGALWQLSLRSSTDSPANVLVAGEFSGSAYQQAAAGTPTNDVWSHGAAVFISDTERICYLNASATTNTTSNGTANANRLCIGAVGRDSRAEFANSKIAEVGIWNAALTAAEIASLAKGMTCDKVRPQNLVFYAPLVRDLNDQKGGLTITNNGGATVAAHPRVYA